MHSGSLRELTSTNTICERVWKCVANYSECSDSLENTIITDSWMSVDRGLNMLHKHGSKSHGAVYKGRGAFLKSVSYQNHTHILLYFRYSLFFFQIFSEMKIIKLWSICFFYNFLFNLFEFLFSFRIKRGWEHRCNWRSNRDVISPRHDPLQTKSERDAMWHHRAKTTDDVTLSRRIDLSTSLRLRGGVWSPDRWQAVDTCAATCTRVSAMAMSLGRVLLARTMTNRCWLHDDCRRFSSRSNSRLEPRTYLYSFFQPYSPMFCCIWN